MTHAACLAPVLKTTAPHSFPFQSLVTRANRDLKYQGSVLELCRGLIPAGNPAPRSRSLTPPTQWDEGENWKK